MREIHFLLPCYMGFLELHFCTTHPLLSQHKPRFAKPFTTSGLSYVPTPGSQKDDFLLEACFFPSFPLCYLELKSLNVISAPHTPPTLIS